MYNILSQIQEQTRSISPEQEAEIKAIEDYLEKNKVHEVLNVWNLIVRKH